MGRTKHEKTWNQFVTVQTKDSNETSRCEATCKHCAKHWENANITRLGQHLLKCKTYLESKSTDLNGNDLDSDEDNPPIPLEDGAPAQNSSKSLVPEPVEGAPPKKKAKTVTRFIDSMSKEEIEKANVLLARAVYSSSSPLSLTENKHWQALFKYLRPAYEVPSRYKLSGPILDEEFQRVQLKTKEELSESTALGLLTDGWTNTSGDGLINFIVTCPQPLFFKSINRGIERETAVYVADKCITVIEEIGPGKFLVVVTDCAANMRAARKIIIEKYPHISAIGCADHCLQNFMHDLMKLSSLKRLHIQSKNAVKEFKYSHVKLAALKQNQKDKYGAKTVALKLPPKTRFYYVVLTLESLVQNKEALQATVIDSSLEVSTKIKRRILSEDKFWPKVVAALQLLQPLTVGIKILERNSATLSEAVEVMFLVKKKVEDFLLTYDDEYCNLGELRQVGEDFQNRFQMSFKPIHFATNLIDPRFRGENLTDDQRLEGYQYLSDLANHLHIENENGEILENLGHFRDKTGFFSREILWEAAKTQKPYTWWKGLCGSQVLSPLASRLLQLPPTTAAAERNWSEQAAVHTDVKNRLLPERVRKLVAVKHELNRDKNDKKKTLTFKEVNDFLCANLSSSFCCDQDYLSDEESRSDVEDESECD